MSPFLPLTVNFIVIPCGAQLEANLARCIFISRLIGLVSLLAKEASYCNSAASLKPDLLLDLLKPLHFLLFNSFPLLALLLFLLVLQTDQKLCLGHADFISRNNKF